MKWRVGAFLAALLLTPVSGFAQIQPAGSSFTPGHTVRVLTPQGTALGDAGGAAGSALPGQGYLTELGITNTGTPSCINDALTSVGYHQLCFGANALGGGLISYNAHGGASPLPLQCDINGQLVPCFSGVAGLQTVPNNTTLKALSGTTAGQFVYRQGYYSSGDGGGSLYTFSSGSCSLNAGAGDNGLQVAPTGGGCWLASLVSPFDLRVFGVRFDGSTDNSTALANAFAAMAAGNNLYCPADNGLRALFGTGTTITIGNGVSLVMTGAGSEACHLEFTASSGTAISIISSGNLNNASGHFRDFSLTTTHAGLANGIEWTYTGSASNEPPIASDITNVTFRGSDGVEQTNYFATALAVGGGASWFNFLVNIAGSSPPAGQGLVLESNVGRPVGIVYNVQPGSNFSQLAAGIVYGINSQGLAVTQANFTGDSRGIYQPDPGENNAQLSVTNSQFGVCLINCIDLQANSGNGNVGVQIANNLFFTPDTGGCGINANNLIEPTITGNDFTYALSPQTGCGIKILSNSSRGGTITGNTCSSQITCINLGAGTQLITVSGNAYNNTLTFLSNSSTLNNNTGSDIWIPYTPAYACATGSATATTDGAYNITGLTVNFWVHAVVSAVSSCVNLNLSTPGIPYLPLHAGGGGAVDETLSTGLPFTWGSTGGSSIIDMSVAAHTYSANGSYQIAPPAH